MLSKSLTQLSVDGWGSVPSLLFTWGQTMVEVVKIMPTSFKRSHAGTATLSAPSPAAGHCLQWDKVVFVFPPSPKCSKATLCSNLCVVSVPRLQGISGLV